MRALFYTATAFFIVLAGVFGFYALQGSDRSNGAKVVLSIEPTEAPASTAAAEPERDLYSEVAAKLQRLEAKHSGDTSAAVPETPAAEKISADEGDRLPVEGESESQSAPRLSQSEDFAAPAAEEQADAGTQQQAQDDSGLPLGTAIAGLAPDDPLFKHTRPETESEVAAPAPPDNVTATSAETQLRGTQLNPEPQEDLRLTSPAAEQPEVAEQQEKDVSERLAPEEQNQAAAEAEEVQIAAASPAEEAPSEAATERKSSPEERAKLEAFMAALHARDAENEKNEAASDLPSADVATIAPAGPPPPLPAKRPNIRTALLEGWGNTKITKAEPAALKTTRVAILLRGVGRDDRNSDDAVTKLPPAVSLAFMPFAGAAQQWARKAREQGHEVIVQLPLEPSDYPINNPGPETLLASSAPDENASRLGTILARFEGYSGVTNFLGGRLLQSETALRPILENVKSRGLIYVGEGNNSHALVRGIAGKIGLRYGGADVLIDAHPTPQAIQKALDQLVLIARKEGTAIGLGYASRVTIEQLEAWSKGLSVQGVTLVPVGALAQTPGAS